MYNLSVNANHPLVGTLLQKNEEEQQAITKQLVDLALLAQGMLKGEALDQFIQRNIEHIA